MTTLYFTTEDETLIGRGFIGIELTITELANKPDTRDIDSTDEDGEPIVIQESFTTYLCKADTTADNAQSVLESLDCTILESTSAQLLGETMIETGEEINIISLDEVKANRIIELEIRTTELIEQGFTYDSRKFGASLYDQAQWNSLLGLQSVLPYPLENIVKDFDGEYYTIADQTALLTIVSTGMAIVVGHKATHKTLKDSIKTATSIQAVLDIVDNRT